MARMGSALDDIHGPVRRRHEWARRAHGADTRIIAQNGRVPKTSDTLQTPIFAAFSAFSIQCGDRPISATSFPKSSASAVPPQPRRS